MDFQIFKLHASSRGYPTIQGGALPRGYMRAFFNGQRLPASWTPPPFEIRGAKGALPDIIAWKETLPLLSGSAVALFEEVAPGCAEYRECVAIRSATYSVVNVLAQEDIFDPDRSETSPAASGASFAVRRYAFKAARTGNPLFKLANMLDGPVFVTRGLARAIVSAGLTGFQFRDPAVNETALLFRGVDVNAFPD